MTEPDFERDMEINPDALDVEWLAQPELYCRYANAASEAEAVAKRASEHKKTTEANLTHLVNAEPDRLQGAKPTVANVQSYIQLHPDYGAAMTILIEAEHDAARLRNGMFAMNQRKDALENLVRLCLGQYFAGPVSPRDLKKEWAESGRDSVVDRQRERKAGRARK